MSVYGFDYNDLIGVKCGLLTVLECEVTEIVGMPNKYVYNCKCVCGKNVMVSRQSIIKKRRLSCGCAGIGSTKKKFKNILLERSGSDRISWNWMQAESAVQFWDIIEQYFINKESESVQRYRFTLHKAELLILPGELIVPHRLKNAILAKKHDIFAFARNGNSSFRYQE
jgi:hypothetical protein